MPPLAPTGVGHFRKETIADVAEDVVVGNAHGYRLVDPFLHPSAQGLLVVTGLPISKKEYEFMTATEGRIMDAQGAHQALVDCG